MKDAETPVFTRVFGVFYVRTAKILVAKRLSISKRISKNFLEIFLEMHPCLCGCFRGGCAPKAKHNIKVKTEKPRSARSSRENPQPIILR